jgi:hypothetical protein
MSIQLPQFFSYDHLQIKLALFGRNIEVNLFNMSLAILFVFLISRMMMFMNGLRVLFPAVFLFSLN